jgi:purine-nucleoside phosphorylase
MLSEFDRAEQAAQYVFAKTARHPLIALVLGSGLGAFADSLANAVSIPYAEIPHYPRPTAEGRRSSGNRMAGDVGYICRTFTCMKAGQMTSYLPSWADGVVAAILTNAAGGINPPMARLPRGVEDHINLSGSNPLAAPMICASGCAS